MDLIGDIVEHEPQAPTEPVIEKYAASSGFPQLKKFDGIKLRNSRFKAGALSKVETGKNPATSPETPAGVQKEDNLTEAQRIHQENLAKISSLTEDELTKEREELLQGLDPKLIQTLLKRTEARASEHDHDHDHAEGYDGWIGGGKNGAQLPSLNDVDVNRALGIKSVSFKEDLDFEEAPANYPLDHFTDDEEEVPLHLGDDEEAPEGYQIITDPESEDQDQDLEPVKVHFPQPKHSREDPDLDLDDPAFFDQLHEKYFPDLPKETSKLAWMTTPMPSHKVSSYEAIGEMRFDFKGNLVELDEKSQNTPTHLGLHHHSDNPQLAGYTLAELVHLSRSVVPTQRCLGIQMLGRILHKLGLHKYNIMPIVDENSGFGEASRELMVQFEAMMWDLVENLRVVESLTEASDESKTRNLSVRTYAIEALWLWKQGGGRPKTPAKSEADILAENLQNM